MQPEIVAPLTVELTKMAVSGIATAIMAKIASMRNEKNIETVRNTYEEIVTQLISERAEAIRIAQSLESELDRIKISAADMDHLNKTLENLVKTLGLPAEQFEPIKVLINADTLKAAQLLGFNFKAAIGEPLTNLCANAISSFPNKAKSPQQGQNVPHKNKK